MKKKNSVVAVVIVLVVLICIWLISSGVTDKRSNLVRPLKKVVPKSLPYLGQKINYHDLMMRLSGKNDPYFLSTENYGTGELHAINFKLKEQLSLEESLKVIDSLGLGDKLEGSQIDPNKGAMLAYKSTGVLLILDSVTKLVHTMSFFEHLILRNNRSALKNREHK